MKSRLRRGTAALAVGAVAALAAAAPAPASPVRTATEEDERLVPTVTTGTLSRLVPYDATADAAFVLKADGRPWARKPVKACTGPVGADLVCVTSTTTATGTILVRRFRVTAPVQVNVVVPESTANQSVTSDTVVFTPQVALKATRQGSTLVVALNHAAGQRLLLKRQVGDKWLIDRIQLVTGKVTTLTGLTKGQRYLVVIADAGVVKGTVSGIV